MPQCESCDVVNQYVRMLVVQSRWQNDMKRNKILQEKAEALHLPFENLTFSLLRLHGLFTLKNAVAGHTERKEV